MQYVDRDDSILLARKVGHRFLDTVREIRLALPSIGDDEVRHKLESLAGLVQDAVSDSGVLDEETFTSDELEEIASNAAHERYVRQVVLGL